MVPTIRMRQLQYKHNKETMVQVQSSCTAYDWIVTMAFYSALHLVDAHLQIVGKKVAYHAMGKKGKRDSHEIRNNLVIREKQLGDAIAAAYNALFRESIKARYECVPFSSKRVRDALEYLNIIEKNLLNDR